MSGLCASDVYYVGWEVSDSSNVSRREASTSEFNAFKPQSGIPDFKRAADLPDDFTQILSGLRETEAAAKAREVAALVPSITFETEVPALTPPPPFKLPALEPLNLQRFNLGSQTDFFVKKEETSLWPIFALAGFMAIPHILHFLQKKQQA